MEQTLSLPRPLNSYFFAAATVVLVAVIFHFVSDTNYAFSLILFLGITPLLLGNRKLFVFSIALSFFFFQTPVLFLGSLFDSTRWFLLATGVIIAIIYPIAARRPFMTIGKTRWVWLFPSFAFLTILYSVSPGITIQRTAALTALFFVTSYLIKPLAADYGADEIVNVLLYATFVPYLISMFFITSDQGYNIPTATYQGLKQNKMLSTALNTPQAFQSGFQFNRFHGFFLNPNTIGLLTSLLLPLVLQKVINDKKKAFSIFFLFTMVTALLLSGSREGILVSVISTIYVLSRQLGFKKFLGYIFFGILPLALVLLPLILRVLHAGWLSSYFRVGTNLILGGGRVEAWLVALQIISARPLLGYGFGTEDYLFNTAGYRFLFHEGVYAHNSYIGLTMQVGLLGAALFFFPLIYLFISELKAENPSPLRIGLQGMLLSALVSCMSESWIYAVGNTQAFVFWSCMALLEFLRFTESKKAAVNSLS